MTNPDASFDPHCTDQELVAGLLAGDETAFDRLWRFYYPRVFHFSLNLLKHDRDLADDVAQEVFVHCFEKIRQFRFESRLSTWMMSIAYRKCCRAMRLAHRTLSLNEQGPDGETMYQDLVASLGVGPDQSAMWREILEKYHDALAKLNDEQRTAWILHREQGLPHEEIAGVIGKTPNSCRILVSRARVRLMEHMGVESLAEIAPAATA